MKQVETAPTQIKWMKQVEIKQIKTDLHFTYPGGSQKFKFALEGNDP